MYMRAFRTAPCEPTPGAYATLSQASPSPPPPSFALAPPAVPGCRLRRFVYPTFFIGIHTTTASNSRQALAPRNMVGPEALQVSWKEIWNTLDILYDEVQLLPVKSTKVVSACLRAAGLAPGAVDNSLSDAERDAAMAAFVEAARDGRLAPQLTGSKKIAVCPHYFASEARETASLCPILERRAAACPHSHCNNEKPSKDITLSDPPNASSSSSSSPPTVIGTNTRIIVLDVSPVTETDKLAVELSWLAAFLLLQPGMSHRAASDGPADILVVHLPFDNVPSIQQLEETAAQTTDTSAAAVASAMLALLDFIGQHLSMLWEGGAGSVPPRLCFTGAGGDVGSSSDWHWVRDIPTETAEQQKGSSIDLLWVSSDHVDSPEVLKEQAAALERVATTLSSSGCATTIGSTEHWKVPLKALKEGEEEEWDPYTQRERARLNFCPCCGDCGHGHSGHGHGHGH